MTIQDIGVRFATAECTGGGPHQLSVRDVVHATTAAITLAGIAVPAGGYTLWTVPRSSGAADLIVNKQSGQWGTEYDGARDLGMARMQTGTNPAPVEEFTIAIAPLDDRHGTLSMQWGPFRWMPPIAVR